MNNLLQYLAESSLALLLLYAVYALLLSRQTCFTFNRFYLLVALLFSLVIPFLKLPAWPPEPTLPTNAMLVQVQPAGEIYQTPIMMATPTETETLNFGAWLYGMYAVGVLVAIIFFCCQFLRLYNFIYSHAPEGYYWQRIKVIPTHGEMATFSFLHYILFDNSQPHTPAEKELILRHEQAHLAQKHTFDILYLKLLTIIFWFNPLLYFYKKALESTHEYLADAAVLQDEEVDTYATLLVQQVFHKTDSSFGNFFHLHQSLTLKRLAMMKKFRNPISLVRPLLVLPVVCVFAVAFASNQPVYMPEIFPASPSVQEKITGFFNHENNNNFRQFISYITGSDKRMQAPSFPGGKEQLNRFFLQNLKFTPQALEKPNFTGIGVTIKIDKEGHPEVRLDSDKDLNGQEIVRIMKAMPRWTPTLRNGQPVASEYYFTILFKEYHQQPKSTPKEVLVNTSAEKVNVYGTPVFGSEPLYVDLNAAITPTNTYPNNNLNTIAEISEPSFPDGKEQLYRFLLQHLKFEPEAFGKEAVRGTVVSIKIDKEGNPENAFADNRDLVNQEINRVIGLMPRWIPAYQDEKGVPSRYELQLIIDRKAKHSVISPNKLAKNGALDSEGIPTFGSDIIHLGLNPVTGTPKNFLDQEAIVAGEITEPTFPGGQAAMERYFRENLNLEKVVGQELENAKEFALGRSFGLEIDQDGNVKKLPLENITFEVPENSSQQGVIIRAVGKNFTYEVIRLINNMPQWKPATKDGKPISASIDAWLSLLYTSTPPRSQKRNEVYSTTSEGKISFKTDDIRFWIPYKTENKKTDEGNNNQQSALKLPQFSGGKNALKEYLSSHINYPATALKNKIAGQAILQATIDTDGKVTNFKTLHTDNPYFEQEALSVLREMPRWEPALKDGKAVPFNLVFPFVFALESKQNIPALRLPANRSQLYVQDAITITGYSQVIPGKTFVKKETLPTRTNPKPQNPVQDDDKVFTFVEQIATFPGGEAALNKFINQNLKYPAEAQRQGVSGLVVAQFIVDKSGKIINPQVVKSLGAGTDEEVIRLIKLMPNFSPARQNGNPVNFRYTIPVRFGPNAAAPAPGTGAAPAPTMPDKVFTFVEMQPQFPGGTTALNEFIKKTLQYPAEAVNNKVEGLVVVQFVVDATGKIIEPKVVKPLDPKLDEEALRMVKAMPEFQPARQNNRKVAFRYTMPFRFALPAEPVSNEKDK